MRGAKEDEMTKLLLKILPVVALVGLVVSSVPAQAADITATVPFAFTVKGKTLPTGRYEIGDTNGALVVRGLRDGAIVLGLRTESRNGGRARLVFHKYGETYVLRQAWTGTFGREIPVTREERELARAAEAGQIAGLERVVIPAL
jgi:hypothetical protein